MPGNMTPGHVTIFCEKNVNKFRNATLKVRYILQNVIHIENNTLAVRKTSLIIVLTIMNLHTVNLKTKNKFPKKL